MAEGFRRAGIPFDAVVDKNADAAASYEANHRVKPWLLDVRDLLRMVRAGWKPATPLELLVADPPCTPWSSVGNRQGLADERDTLPETCDLIRALGPDEWMIANVPGLDTEPNRPALEATIGSLRGPYCVDYVSLDAADYGVPQHRNRPFWFGHRKGTACIRWPEPTHGDWSTIRMDELKPWVTCRTALADLAPEELGRFVRLRRRDCNGKQHGSVLDRPARVVGTSGLSDGNVLLPEDGHQPSKIDEPARTITTQGRSGSGGAMMLVPGSAPTKKKKRVRPFHNAHPATNADEPARTITAGRGQAGGGGGGKVLLLNRKHPPNDLDRPSRTMTASNGGNGPKMVMAPHPRHPASRADEPAMVVRTNGGRAAQAGSMLMDGAGAIILSERAAALLQGFPPGWVFAGKTKTSRWSQIGQAMPPPLAHAVANAIVSRRAK